MNVCVVRRQMKNYDINNKKKERDYNICHLVSTPFVPLA